MAYVIGEPCIDVMDRACVEECPVDCIYEGGRLLYIHPDECVDCGACEPVSGPPATYDVTSAKLARTDEASAARAGGCGRPATRWSALHRAVAGRGRTRRE